jgi:hypothetical protein
VSVTVRLYSPWKTIMTSGQDVSEYLGTLGLVKSYFSSFFREHECKTVEKKIKKSRFFYCGAPPTPQRMRRFACLQDCLLTLTCHLADSTCSASGGTEALVKKDSQVLGNLSRASLRGRSGREWGQERHGFRNRCPARFWVISSGP